MSIKKTIFVRPAGLAVLAAIALLGAACGGSNSAGNPDAALQSPFGFHPAAVTKPGYAGSGYIDAQNIGVKWDRGGVYAFWFIVQPDLTQQVYDFSLYDAQWSKIPAGIRILANIAPQARADVGYALPGGLPVDVDKYSLFVKATVERYDGDGVEDMPGLQNPIKYWQVGNEPQLLRESNFAELQKITYTAIKAGCPDCTVLIGGVPGQPPLDVYLANFDTQYKPFLDALGGKYVDVMDFHWYGEANGDYRDAKPAYLHIRSAMTAAGFDEIPVWITEMGAYSGDPTGSPANPAGFPAQTERQQALDYFKRFVYPLSFGVKKIFPAFGLMEGFKFDDAYFDHTGLIYDGWGSGDRGTGVKKLAYFTYKKMTEMLEGSDWGAIETIRESGGIFIYKFTRTGKPVYVAWWDYFNDATYSPGKTITVSLTGLEGASGVVSEAVPKFAAGSEVADYATAFRRETLAISGGTATFAVGDSPVFIELPPLSGFPGE